MDGIMYLTHLAQSCLLTNHVAATIFFNIQGFFDNLNTDSVAHLFDIYRFLTGMVHWVKSFLHNRRVHLSFNGHMADPLTINRGTPQGSPLSPILSTLYTAPLLHLLTQQDPSPFTSFQLYVNDGCITASGQTYRSAITKAAKLYERASVWLNNNSLQLDPGKMEFLLFWGRHSGKCFGTLITDIAVQDARHGIYTIKHKAAVRYLGMFLTPSLDWHTHVEIMSARARSMITALSILGNSMRGLDYANWRKVYHSLIVPILTYGSPVWFTDRQQRGLIKTLQVAQNDACRKISGCFRTMPMEPLHHLLSIPPICFTLHKLTSIYTRRLLSLPPTSPLLTAPGHNPLSYWRPSFFPPTTLQHLVEFRNPNAPHFTYAPPLPLLMDTSPLHKSH
jgi:Reverse transcriptase (RNA-dependent DNA polymerase)